MIKQRQTVLARLNETPKIDVLLIGGGINGISTFRELALQGIDVVLVERNDFCSGASAASSHMAHGGIRYLENGEFRLVREAVKERNRLIANAPHYVKPLATTIPIFNYFSGLFNAPLKFLGVLNKPAERGAAVIKAGLIMYDAYTGDQRTVPRHVVTNRTKSLQQFPQLSRDILYTATYYDGSLQNPERIGLEVLFDGAMAHDGAYAVNYVSAVSADANTVLLCDEITGTLYGVRPKLVINAGGPWIDFINTALGEPTKFVGGTKGSHIMLDHPELHDACGGHEFFFENKDGRIVLIYPIHGRVMVGTSDLRIDNPDDASCTDEEIEYFLRFINIVFPEIAVDEAHIIYQFSGVRPLPHQDADTTGQISRDHSTQIITPMSKQFAIYNLVGGKWTTFRAFGEQVADKALGYLGKMRHVRTEDRPFGGGVDYPTNRSRWVTDVAVETGIAADWIQIWFDRYGTRAQQIATYAATISQDDAPDPSLLSLPDYSRAEMQFIVMHEQVVHLSDILQRRTLLALTGRVTHAVIAEIAEIARPLLGWSDERTQTETAETIHILTTEHNVALKQV